MTGPRRPRSVAWALVAALASVQAGPLAAQACRGVPLESGGIAVTVLASRPDPADHRIGADASFRLRPPLLVAAGFARAAFDGDVASAEAVRGRVTLDVAPRLPGALAAFAVCPTVAVERERYGDLSVLTVPLGLAVGVHHALDERWGVTAFVEPRAVYSRRNVVGMTRTRADAGFAAGVNLHGGPIFLGVGYDFVDDPAARSELSLRLGARLAGGAGSTPPRQEREP